MIGVAETVEDVAKTTGTAAHTRRPALVRGSLERWQRVHGMLRKLERLILANATIDLGEKKGRYMHTQMIDAEKQYEMLQQIVDEEVTRLTVEGLHSGLAQRMKRDKKKESAS